MARRSRSRDLAGLAALGALGYSIFGAEGRRRKDGTVAPVEYRGTDRPPTVRGDMSSADLYADAALAQQPEIREHVFDAPMGVRENVFDPGAAPEPARRPAAAPARAAASSQRLASPAADFPSAGRTRAAPAAPAAAPPMSLRQQLTQTTLGTPIGPAPGAPSIYASSEARAAYRQQQAAERAAQPPTQQGSARNIVQQMREKDKAVLAAVRRRQAEEEAAAQALREAEAERRREARRVQPPSVNPAASRFQDIQARMQGFKKGGAVKAKKMASGGMSSASKRADGIATKGKTKCKMY